MSDFPASLVAFQRRFADDDACAAYLAEARWPDGFRCPACGHGKGWKLAAKPWTFECAGCRRQTSVTAGTVLHGSKLPLTVWFWAAYLMATHSNGISALQLQHQLGLGSYKSAWLMAHKLRRAMVAPGRAPLAGLVEVDETSLPQRTRSEPPAGGGGRSPQGKMLLAGAVEVAGGRPGRCASPPSPTPLPRACTASSAPMSRPAGRPRPTAGPAMAAPRISATSRTSSGRWSPIWCCPGCTALRQCRCRRRRP